VRVCFKRLKKPKENASLQKKTCKIPYSQISSKKQHKVVERWMHLMHSRTLISVCMKELKNEANVKPETKITLKIILFPRNNVSQFFWDEPKYIISWRGYWSSMQKIVKKMKKKRESSNKKSCNIEVFRILKNWKELAMQIYIVHSMYSVQLHPVR
jgi:hypothetical protein